MNDDLFKRFELFKNLKLVFFVTLLIGIVLITRMAYEERQADSVIYISILMVSYGVYIWKRKDSKYTSQEDPDTLYYLGFIFTLATLVASLVPFINKPEALKETTVLGIFGLGLITTFLGLTGRILLSQFQAESTRMLDSSIDNAAKAIDDISFKLDHFARDIEDSNNKISNSYEQITGKLNDANRDISNNMQAISETAITNINNISNNTFQTMSTTIETFTNTIKNINIPFENIKESLNEPVVSLAETIKKANKSISAFEKKLSLSSYSSLDKIIEGHNNFIKDLTEIYNKHVEKVTNVLDELKYSPKNINSLSKDLSIISDVVKSMETFTSKLPSMIMTTDKYNEQLNQAINMNIELNIKFNAQFNNLLNNIKQVNEAVNKRTNHTQNIMPEEPEETSVGTSGHNNSFLLEKIKKLWTSPRKRKTEN